MEHWTEAEVTGPPGAGHEVELRIIRDIARNQPGATVLHDSRRYCVGKPVDTRTAAMILALKRIEAHYLLEGFSQ